MLNIKQILKDKPGWFVSYFILLLVLSEDNDKLIDVLELFGIEKLEVAIERLGGSTVTFPTWQTIDTLVSDAYLLVRMDSFLTTAEYKRELEKEFGAPFKSLKERAKALRSSINKPITNGEFPGARKAKKWNKNLADIKVDIETSKHEENKADL
jgi:hypothetical protein